MAVRPDGTDTQTLIALPHRHAPFVWAPVWSPDSKKLLLNEIADWEAWTMNANLLDLTTHKLTRKSRTGVAVLGWGPSN